MSEPTRIDPNQVQAGQIWRRKKSGKLIRIVRPYRTEYSSSDDWVWEGHDYKGRGLSYGIYIRRNCELTDLLVLDS